MSEEISFPERLPELPTILDTLPVSLIIYRPDGILVWMNRSAEQLWVAVRAGVIGRFNILEDPQSVEQGSHELFARVLAGETVITPAVEYDTRLIHSTIEVTGTIRIWVESTVFPMRTTAGTVSQVVIMHRNVTERIEQMRAIDAAQNEIRIQRQAILSLSSPVVQVWEGILALPLVGSIDTRRAQAITEDLLNAIVQHQTDIVIIDITGVPVVDTLVASYLISAARAVRLLGSQVVVVGISAEIAQTLVQLGFESNQFMTLANLQAGIAWAFEQLGLEVSAQGYSRTS